MPRLSLMMMACAAFSAVVMGCEAPGVGDPCSPESVPMGGFVATEAYLETSSVQCRTRVCMVYQLRGDLRKPCDAFPTDPDCADPTAINNRIFCTCRCKAPSDPDANVCDCPDGYTCTEILDLGGPGIQGSYCVKNEALSAG